MKDNIRRVLGVMIVFLFFLGGFIYNHEMTHKQIYYYYGIDSTISFDWNRHAIVTVPSEPIPHIPELQVSQNMVDVFGYQLFMVYAVLVIIMITGLLKK